MFTGPSPEHANRVVSTAPRLCCPVSVSAPLYERFASHVLGLETNRASQKMKMLAPSSNRFVPLPGHSKVFKKAVDDCRPSGGDRFYI